MPSKAKKANTQVNAAQPQPLNHISKGVPPPTADSRKPDPKPSQGHAVNGQHLSEKPETDSRTGDTTESAGEPAPATNVNRKKQKRREKEAAKRAAENELANGNYADIPRQLNNVQPHRSGRGPTKGSFTEEPDLMNPSHPEFGDVGSPDDAFYSGDDAAYDDDGVGGPGSSWLNTSKRKKGSKSKRISNPESNVISRTSTAVSRPSFPSVSNAALRSAHRMGDQIWNTSTQAERENIKQFWLELGEEERRSLVKVEKEAVLRKMKEQQKHSCSCSVCGRKRTAIEEELEVLYDAYYEELEQFANHNADLSNPPQIMPPPRAAYRRAAQPIPGSFSSRNRIHEIGEDDEDLDDEDDYDEDEEPYSDEEDELDDHGLPPGPPDFFQFGNSLTVKDGILTVADDLLKNDGKHFIDMMEQLAERRMQREEEIYPSSALAHQDIHQGHNHPPIDEDDDYDDEEDDEDYDSQEEDDYEGDEMDSMTEEQRMEEGRRMFQIFAARMFEQRVLTAYREKVAAERQAKLLQELDEESRLDTQREAKKAREAAKKKEKKRQQKQAKEEEKAKKEAEKAAQEAAVRQVEEKKLEEQRQRKDEQRKKREAERKAAEEDRLRKEAEKQRRQQEERERQADAERKQREAKERERKKREDAKKKERDEREAKEKDVRERKAQEDRERKVKEEQAKRDREATLRPDKDAKAGSSHTSSVKTQAVALPPGLHPPARGAHLQSPHFQVATPIMPAKIPTPGRNRQASQPGLQPQSHSSSPRSQKAGTEQSTSPASVAVPQTPTQGLPAKMHGQQPLLHHPQPSAPRSPLNNHGRGQYQYNMNGMPGLGVSGPPVSGPGMMPPMMPPMPMYQGPPMGNQGMGNQGRFAPNGMQFPPGFGGPRHFQPGQAMPFHPQAPVAPPVQPPPQTAPNPPHSRQPSGSTINDSTSQPAPIARPGPIARPSSTTPDRKKAKHRSPDPEVEQITTQLGSKALLDDSDEPILTNVESRTSLPPVGAPGSTRMPFASSFPDSKPESFSMGNPGWGGFNSGLVGAPGWGAPGPPRPNPGWSQPPFGAIGGGAPTIQRSHLPRPIAVRLMLVQACRQLSAGGEVYHAVQSVLHQLEGLKAPGEPAVSMDEMLGICDTEGNAQNGGGSFEVVMDGARGQVVKFSEDGAGLGPGRNSVGDIGSPMAGHSQTSGFAIGSGFGPPGRNF